MDTLDVYEQHDQHGDLVYAIHLATHSRRAVAEVAAFAGCRLVFHPGEGNDREYDPPAPVQLGPAPAEAPAELVAGPVTVDWTRRRVTVDGAPLDLTATEYALVKQLATDPRRVWERPELLRAVWGYATTNGVDSRALDTHVSRIRRKLERAGAPGLLVNRWGVGYSLLPQNAEEELAATTAAVAPIAAAAR